VNNIQKLPAVCS